MQFQILCQAFTDLLDEKKIIPLQNLRKQHFDEFSEYRHYVIQELKLPEEIFDIILEEAKIQIFSCCGRTYYFPPEEQTNHPQVCLNCARPLTNQYDWEGRVPTLYIAATGEKISVEKDSFYIGRNPDSDLVMNNSDLSRRHCCLRKVKTRYKVVDLESRNGTFLNQKRIVESYIKPGDVLRFGKKAFLVVGHIDGEQSKKHSDESAVTHFGNSSFTDMLIGEKINQYVIQKRLGKGGVGVVYLAQHAETHQMYALKIIRSSKQEESDVVARFRKEKKILEQLRSPYIIEYIDAGYYSGLYYIVLEYFGDGSLGDYLRENQGKLSLYLSLKVMIRVLLALEAAHQHGVIHRDIKPDNILIDHTFDVKITDFGLMKNLEASHTEGSTVTGMTLGTPSYMAPEQVKTAKAVSPQTDLYGVAATLYHLLAGRPPYDGASAIEIIMKVGVEPIPMLTDFAPQLPLGLCEVIHKALAFHPEERYENARQFRKLLEPFLNE